MNEQDDKAELVAAPGREVSNRFIRDLVRHAERRGLAPAALLEAAGLSKGDLGNASGRQTWEAFASLLDALQGILGGPRELDPFGFEGLPNAGLLAAVAPLLVSPLRLYRFGAERIGERLFGSSLSCSVEQLPTGEIRFERAISLGRRPSLPFMFLQLGHLRGLPSVLGLPPAEVTADITERKSIYLIVPPDERPRARAPSTAARRALAARLAGEPSARPLDPDEDLALDLALSAFADEVGAAGQSLAHQRGLPTVAERLFAIAREWLFAGGVTLWVLRSGSARLEHVATWGDLVHANWRVRTLAVGDRVVGRVEVSLPGTNQSRFPVLLDMLVPWLSVAVEGCLRAEEARGPARPGAASDVDRDRRLELAARLWGLTERQVEVLRLLTLGCANKEIGAALGTTRRTVEFHVSRILQKLGVTDRQELVAKFWAGTAFDGPTGP